MNDRRMDDITLWRASHEVKRIASHQGQRRRHPRAQYAGVIRTDNSNIVHYVNVRSVASHQLHTVAHLQVFEAAKEAVSVGTDSDVAPFVRSRRAPDPACSAVQGEVIGSIQDRHFEVDTFNPQHSQRGQQMFCETSFVGIDPRL